MQLRVVGSGSKGNCYVIESEGRHLILDAGMKYLEIQKAVNFDLESIDGVLVTHGHADHAKAVPDLLANGIDVYMSRGTMDSILEDDDYLRDMANIVKTGDQFKDGQWSVLAFNIDHDAQEPLGFLIKHKESKYIYMTDSASCKYKFVGLSHVIVECNYILDIINSNFVSSALKRRVLSSHAGLEYLIPWLKSLDCIQLQKVILVHLSDRNSDVARMKAEVENAIGVDTVIAEAGQTIDLTECGF